MGAKGPHYPAPGELISGGNLRLDEALCLPQHEPSVLALLGEDRLPPPAPLLSSPPCPAPLRRASHPPNHLSNFFTPHQSAVESDSNLGDGDQRSFLGLTLAGNALHHGQDICYLVNAA